MARNASHAGSWYKANGRELGDELDKYLRAANLDQRSNARAVIAPHAGYRYSGRCAAFAFGNIDPSTISRVFILGPSHYHFTRKCALSRVSVYETPLGNLPIDLEIYQELKATGKFEDMDINVDEAEHSMEMHYAILRRFSRGQQLKSSQFWSDHSHLRVRLRMENCWQSILMTHQTFSPYHRTFVIGAQGSTILTMRRRMAQFTSQLRLLTKMG